MSIMSAVISHLLNHAGTSALVGDRVYPMEIPKSTSAAPNQMPLIVCKLLDEPELQTHDNQPIFQARVQVISYGGTYKSSHAVDDQVYASLKGYRGHMGDQSVYVGGCFRAAKRDRNFPDVDLFSVEHEFTINWKE